MQTGLVTGASRGIGAAVATALAARPTRLFLTGRDTAALDAVKRGLFDREIHTYIPADLERPDEISLRRPGKAPWS